MLFGNIYGFIELAFFSIGAVALLRASPLNRLKFKPFSCDVCIGGWAGFFYALLNIITNAVNFGQVLDFRFLSVILVNMMVGAGCSFIFFRIYPNVPSIKNGEVPDVKVD